MLGICAGQLILDCIFGVAKVLMVCVFVLKGQRTLLQCITVSKQ